VPNGVPGALRPLLFQIFFLMPNKHDSNDFYSPRHSKRWGDLGYLWGAGGAPKKLSGVSEDNQARMLIFSLIGTVGVLKNMTKCHLFWRRGAWPPALTEPLGGAVWVQMYFHKAPAQNHRNQNLSISLSLEVRNGGGRGGAGGAGDPTCSDVLFYAQQTWFQ